MKLRGNVPSYERDHKSGPAEESWELRTDVKIDSDKIQCFFF